jgi:hypothetical protein
LRAGIFPARKRLSVQLPAQKSHPTETMPKEKHPDSDFKKGAVEEETSTPSTNGQSNLQGQLGHRDQDAMIKDADSDFPEPGSSPEHSGEHK